ncbi:hypothetical protein [Ruminiclostridium josui]|uniref:hypothetical protein n=1 Tax=Ruminiclostridium josui TaxID=1499 RepID=UPI000466D0C5|nr:hypothetical protein [Ruminiclostridium josui]
MLVAENSKTHEDIADIQRLIQKLEESVQDLVQSGNSIPCIKKNAKQLKVLVEILKIECMDI